MSAEPQPVIRRTRVEDIPALIEAAAPRLPDHRALELGQAAPAGRYVPQGQLMAEMDGAAGGLRQLAGGAVESGPESHTWEEITSAGTFEHHNPDGRTLYGPVFVAPRRAQLRRGPPAVRGRRAICREFNLKRIIIACGPGCPGYHRHAAGMTPSSTPARWCF